MITVSEIWFFVVISWNVNPSALDACAKDNKTVFGFFLLQKFRICRIQKPISIQLHREKSRYNDILKGVITRKNALERGVEMRYYAFHA